MLAKQCQSVEFVQMISRVTTPTIKADYALNWYPDVEVNMTHFAI